MKIVEIIFITGVFIIFYSYFGYAIIVWFLLKLRSLFSGARNFHIKSQSTHQEVTLAIAAFNEADFIEEKIANTLAIDYPEEKLKIIIITDGSSDSTPDIVKKYSRIQLLHQDERRGKIDAMHRAMSFVKTPIVVFTDANTLLNADSIKNIVRHYDDEKVGGVAGEKKVIKANEGAGAGEGLYWKYESFLKKIDSAYHSVVGAAGELFSVRTHLYEYPGSNVLLDDFIISLRVCQKGYKVVYEPAAFAIENGSASIKEERKRKIRISAGGFQSILMLKSLLNIFKYGKLSFLYISHRVLRWTLCPLFLPVILIANVILVWNGWPAIFAFFLIAQIVFYAAAFIGWVLSLQKKHISLFYAPYYFLFINVSLYIGFYRFIKGRQSVLWDKAKREKAIG